MVSKQVIDRVRSAATVSASLETHADEIGRKLGEVLSPLLKPHESMPDAALLMRLLGRMLSLRTATLTEVDAAHEAELADDAVPRTERDAAETELRGFLSRYRGMIGDTFGDEGLRVFGLWDPAPSSTRGVARYATDFVAALRDPSRMPSVSPPPGVTLDRAAIAGVLESAARRLETTIGTVTKEVAEADATLTAKDRAVDHSDAGFLGAAQIGEATFLLVGRPDLAARIRASPRKPGVVQDEEGEGGGAVTT
jgi:hypothetical protein